MDKDNIPELRQNPVSGDWQLVAPGRRGRPDQFIREKKDKKVPKSKCAFENPQKSGNGEPIVWYSKDGEEHDPVRQKDWLVQVIPNKYPALVPHENTCPTASSLDLTRKMEGRGFHEVVISRDHERSLADMTAEEGEPVVRAYHDRSRALTKEDCLKYTIIFHNHGEAAGASIAHPHSQILALPIIPTDVRRSLDGSLRNKEKFGKCVHCEMIAFEQKQKVRVIYQNKKFIVIAPFASSVNFEMRIFPLKHESHFEHVDGKDLIDLSDALTTALHKLQVVLKHPAFNFFIHTAPMHEGQYMFYHWHLEIFPKTSHMAGVELGTGIEVVTMPPEDAAKFLREAK
ncbi:MAG: galactose-1-phosphate uridylyltransferase [bacterium]|nr:galactose-1-phosphate uridylyltransferase [bacterium]